MVDKIKFLTAALCMATFFTGMASHAVADDNDDDDERGARRGNIVKVNCDRGRSIRRRLARVRDGATVLVRGSCAENLVVDSNKVSLVCLDGARIIGNGEVTVRVVARGVRISGCHISGGAFGVSIEGGGSATVAGTTITAASDAGLAIREVSFGRLIEQSLITGNDDKGVLVDQSSAGEILDSTISANGGDGAHVRGASDLTVGASEIIGNTGNGLSVANSANLTLVSENLIEGNGQGVGDLANSSIRCGANSSMMFEATQNFGSGNGNPTSNVTSTGCAVSGNATAPAPGIISGYTFEDAIISEFGGWAHEYNGTITPGVDFTHIDNPGTLAIYSGYGSGTLNDGIVGTSNQDSQIFLAPMASDGTPINPRITLQLASPTVVTQIEILGRQARDDASGNLETMTVTIMGPNGAVSENFTLTPFGSDNNIGIPVNDRLTLIGTTLEGIPTSRIVLSDLRSVNLTPNTSFFMVISEIKVEGTAAPTGP